MLPGKPSKLDLKNILMFAVLAAAIGFVGATTVTTATVYADQDGNPNDGKDTRGGVRDGNAGDGNDSPKDNNQNDGKDGGWFDGNAGDGNDPDLIPLP